MDFEEVVPLPPYHFGGSWLVGATTFAMDRFIPEVELIYQPGADYVGGAMTISLPEKAVTAPAIRPSSRLRRLKARISPLPTTDLGDRIFYDARFDAYFNWSHQINFFLTMALFMRARIGEPMTIVLPQVMPRAATDLYKRFKFDVICTDGPVTGRHFKWSFDENEAIVSRRPELISKFMAEHDEDESVFPFFPDLPGKVFLSRQGNRAISNEPEIEALLAARGYTKVYAEDYTAEQQFALLRQATHLIAVHGAALAPLQFRSKSAPPLHFVEICPVGHMTRLFRIICEQVGGNYAAVRGRLKPEYVEPAYAGTQSFTQFSNDNFEVDPHSLKVALDIEEHGRIIEDHPSRWPLGA